MNESFDGTGRRGPDRALFLKLAGLGLGAACVASPGPVGRRPKGDPLAPHRHRLKPCPF